MPREEAAGLQLIARTLTAAPPRTLASSHPRLGYPAPPLRIPAPCSVVGRMHGLKGMTGVPTTSWRVTAAWLDPKNWNRRHTHAHPPTYPPILHACILDVDIQPLHPCTTSICTSSCTLCMHILMHPVYAHPRAPCVCTSSCTLCMHILVHPVYAHPHAPCVCTSSCTVCMHILMHPVHAHPRAPCACTSSCTLCMHILVHPVHAHPRAPCVCTSSCTLCMHILVHRVHAHPHAPCACTSSCTRPLRHGQLRHTEWAVFRCACAAVPFLAACFVFACMRIHTYVVKLMPSARSARSTAKAACFVTACFVTACFIPSQHASSFRMLRHSACFVTQGQSSRRPSPLGRLT